MGRCGCSSRICDGPPGAGGSLSPMPDEDLDRERMAMPRAGKQPRPIFSAADDSGHPVTRAANPAKRPARPSRLWSALPALLPVLLPVLLWMRPLPGAPLSPAADHQPAATLAPEEKALEAKETQLRAREREVERTLASLDEMEVTEAAVEKARIDMETRQVEAASAQIDLLSASRRLEALRDRVAQTHSQLTRLKAQPQADPQQVAALEAAERKEQALLDLEQRRLQILQRRVDLARKDVALSRRLWEALREAYGMSRERRSRATLAELERALEREKKRADQETAAWRRKLDSISGDDPAAVAERHLLTIRIAQALDRVFLLRTRLALEQARTELQGLPASRPDPALDPAVLEASARQIRQIQAALKPVLQLIDSKTQVATRELALLETNRDVERAAGEVYQQTFAALQSLRDRLQSQRREVARFLTELERQAAAYEQARKEAAARSLTAREPLPESTQEWARIAGEVRALPATMAAAWRSAGGILVEAWGESDLDARSMLVAVELGWVVFVLLLRRIPPPWAGGRLDPDWNFTTKARVVAQALLRDLPWTLWPAGAVTLAGRVLQIPAKEEELLAVTGAVAVALQLFISLSRWIFASELVRPDRRDVGLHRRLVAVAVLMGLLVVLSDLGRLGLISRPVWGLVERAFMAVLLPLAPLTLRLRGRMMRELQGTWGETFWTRVVGLISMAVPLTVFAAALVGLAGYINLAWFLTRKLGLVLLIGLAWAVSRHLLMDATAKLRNWARRFPRRAPLLITGWIDPMEFLARLGLFFVALYAIGVVLGWSSDTGAGALLRDWLNRPLIRVAGTPVTSLDVLLGGVYLAVLVYMALWTRRLSADWLFARIRDRGLRDSLAVFTQYAVVLLGVLVGLNLMGIDLTSLTVFVGALGVGIGFGLQNIANNFVSGLILLVERPVRVDDWVTIDGKEGAVARIGMRSLTLNTWDNQDVVIPNANLISNPFTNWTLSDKLVRTLFVVGIRYQDDPHKAREVIENAVTMQPEVSLERKPRVLLTEFNASSVDFRVEYFVDVSQFSRMEVKSKVMFAIWDALQEADIGIPFPQQDIYIKELPEMLSARKGEGSAREPLAGATHPD